MLLKLGRVSLLAALSMFVFASAASLSSGQDQKASTEQHADGENHASHGAVGDDGEAAASGHGATDGHGDPPGTPPLLSFDVGSAVCNIAIFLGVFAILAKFVWPRILSGLQAREDKIHDDLEAAERANSAAKALLVEYQAKLDDAASQVQATLADARKDGEATGQRIVAEAKAEAERQREQAIAEIETAKRAALSELAGQTSDMAINVARQVVGRELQAADHADLIRQALEKLPSNN